MPPVDVKPVRVTTTELSLSTLDGMNMMFALVEAEARLLPSMTLKLVKLAEIPGNHPFAVVSSTSVAVINAAAKVDGFCGALGLMMFEQVNRTFMPAMSVPELKVTVNTPDVIVAVAVGLFS